MTQYKVIGAQQANVGAIARLRCPNCRKNGTFDTVLQFDCQIPSPQGNVFAGLRSCPNPACRALVFCVITHGGVLLESYPPETIDFDATNIPAAVLSAFEEAIK